ncbi:hypothetical protein B5P44_11525 [Mycobacterium sp. CBMA 213]|nr:hypothetical protein [Mycolicibacterium sp. CBMA 213]
MTQAIRLFSEQRFRLTSAARIEAALGFAPGSGEMNHDFKTEGCTIAPRTADPGADDCNGDVDFRRAAPEPALLAIRTMMHSASYHVGGVLKALRRPGLLAAINGFKLALMVGPIR